MPYKLILEKRADITRLFWAMNQIEEGKEEPRQVCPVVQDCAVDPETGLVWILSNHNYQSFAVLDDSMAPSSAVPVQNLTHEQTRNPHSFDICGDVVYIGNAGIMSEPGDIKAYDKRTLEPTGEVLATGITPKRIKHIGDTFYILRSFGDGRTWLYRLNGAEQEQAPLNPLNLDKRYDLRSDIKGIEDIVCRGDDLLAVQLVQHSKERFHYEILGLVSGKNRFIDREFDKGYFAGFAAGPRGKFALYHAYHGETQAELLVFGGDGKTSAVSLRIEPGGLRCGNMIYDQKGRLIVFGFSPDSTRFEMQRYTERN